MFIFDLELLIKVTFSFHVEEHGGIRCYMYWNGQTMRFHPVDIKYAFKYCFTSKRYREFDKEREKMKEFVKQIKIKDVGFEYFYNSLDKNKNTSFNELN